MFNSSPFLLIPELKEKIITKSSYEEIKVCLDKGCEINEKDENGITVLYHAIIANSDICIIKLLLEYGANIDPANKNFSFLAPAIFIDRADILELLLKYKANPNDKSEDGCSLLKYAIQKENLEALKLLVKYGASLKDKYLFDAAKIDNSEIFEFLLRKGLNPNIKDKNKIPLLFVVAGLLQDLEKTKLLVKYGVNINAKAYIKTIKRQELTLSVLFFILYSQQEEKDPLKLKELVKFIIESGADLNDTFRGDNLLSATLCNNLTNWNHKEALDFEVEKILLKKGVDANINLPWKITSEKTSFIPSTPLTIHNVMKDNYELLKEHMQECKLAKHIADQDQMEEFMELLEQYSNKK